jgi:FkbM family methyltransferase
MTIREFVTKILRRIGGALAGTVHDRMTVQEGMLHQLGAQLDHLKSEVNNLRFEHESLAENQTALLQGSNHTIESLQNSQRALTEHVDMLVRVETAAREIRAALAEFSTASDHAANWRLSLLQSRMDQTDESVRSQVGSVIERIEQSSTQQVEAAQGVLARLDSFEREASTQRAMLQSRMDQADESVRSQVGSVLERIDRSSTQQVEATQGVLARLDSSERAASTQQSLLQSRMDEISESVRSQEGSILGRIEYSSAQQLGVMQDVLARLDSSERAAGAQQGMLQSRMEQTDESIRSQVGFVLAKIEQSSTQQIEAVQGVLAKLESSERAAGAQQSTLQSRLEQIDESVSARVASVLKEVQQSSTHQLELIQSVLARINASASAERQQETNEALGRLWSYISERADHLWTALENEVVQQVCVETSDYGLTNPEIGLISFLYSYLPSRRLIDVGAHVGEFSEALLGAGYEVYAFEPAPPIYEQLISRLSGQDDFHPFQLALGSSEGEMRLHLATDLTDSKVYGDTTVLTSLRAHGVPDGLQFTGGTNVRVRTLKNLHAEGVIPQDVALVKIDTEGFDLEVIRGMEDHRYPVVTAEYWDSEIPFSNAGLLYTLDSLVAEMKRRGYFWHVVLFRIWGRNQIGYYANHDRSVPNSWGNIFFFRDHAVFTQAQMWCSAVLPRIYFKWSAPAERLKDAAKLAQA